jgi:phosphonopyruvate decarboxylase
MRLGALSTVGYERPPNLVLIVFDNGAYESTGDQATLSRSVDLLAIASACGYPHVRELSRPAELATALTAHKNDALTFLRVPIFSGVPDDLPRPKTTPEEVARRMERYIRGTL